MLEMCSACGKPFGIAEAAPGGAVLLHYAFARESW